MPHSAEDPPSAPPAASLESETPGASVPNTHSGDASGGGEPASVALHEGERHRRRRRRRRRPSLTATAAAETAGSESGATAPPVEAGDPVTASPPNASPGGADANRPLPRRRRRRRRGPPPQDGQVNEDREAREDTPTGGETAVVSPEEASPQQTPDALAPGGAGSEHRRPRRRRRRPMRDGSGPAPRVGGESQTGPDAVIEVTSRSDPGAVRSLRIGRPRRRRPGETGRREEPREPGSPQRRTREEEPRGRSRQEAGGRDRDQTPRGRSATAGGARDRRQGRGRDAAPKRPEQKLYALESVVDRGFEDLADDSDDSVTRRVHWAIVKRTVADQKSGKPMSAVYVLQREGVEAQFPNLGAARAAVNKTIIHPEKLTVSKAAHAAEHAAAKK
jgi:hypothetical protein